MNSRPAVAGGVNGPVFDTASWLSPDGRRVYFHAKAPGQTHLDLWVSELQPKAK